MLCTKKILAVDISGIYRSFLQKRLFTSAKEPHISAKEPYTSAKEP